MSDKAESGVLRNKETGFEIPVTGVRVTSEYVYVTLRGSSSRNSFVTGEWDFTSNEPETLKALRKAPTGAVAAKEGRMPYICLGPGGDWVFVTPAGTVIRNAVEDIHTDGWRLATVTVEGDE